MASSAWHQTYGRILNRLQPAHQTVGDAVEQVVAVVQATTCVWCEYLCMHLCGLAQGVLTYRKLCVVQLVEAQCEVDQRDRVVTELRSTCESGKLSELEADRTLQSLRQRLAEYEAAFGDVEGAASRSELTIVTLQQQARETRQRIVELDSLQRSVLILHEACMQSQHCKGKGAVAQWGLGEVLISQTSAVEPVGG